MKRKIFFAYLRFVTTIVIQLVGIAYYFFFAAMILIGSRKIQEGIRAYEQGKMDPLLETNASNQFEWFTR